MGKTPRSWRAAALAVVVALTTGAAAQRWTPPRMPWGDPDLEGVWTSDNNFSIPLERPAAVADKEFLEGKDLEDALANRAKLIAAVADGGAVGAGPSHWYENLTAKSRRSSLIIDPGNGRLPALTAEARARAAAEEASRRGRGPADSWEDRSLWDRCITVGLPAVMFPTGYNNNVQILQAPGYVTVTHEMMHDTRVIPLDGRPHISSRIRQYLGDSRARWEGDTLVIDVTNFHPNTSYRGARETLHLIERYTRTGPDAMRYEVTVDDPRTFERPWTAVLDLAPQKDMYEYACHEGNRGLENILRAARLDDAAAVRGR
ncbi:MAG TPA: hypothetical protein VFD69_13285 [Vicinamibacterales bacterium]|nr:hypothetical protein [Vicinamibacterales bacterium]